MKVFFTFMWYCWRDDSSLYSCLNPREWSTSIAMAFIINAITLPVSIVALLTFLSLLDSDSIQWKSKGQFISSHVQGSCYIKKDYCYISSDTINLRLMVSFLTISLIFPFGCSFLNGFLTLKPLFSTPGIRIAPPKHTQAVCVTQLSTLIQGWKYSAKWIWKFGK